MSLSSSFYYRRNIDNSTDELKRSMYKQAMLDAFGPHVFSDDKMDKIANKKINNGDVHEEQLLYLRNAMAIHEFLVGELTGGVDAADFGPYVIPTNLIKKLVLKGEYVSKYRLIPQGYPYPTRFIEQWEKIVEIFKPIVNNPDDYSDAIVYEASW